MNMNKPQTVEFSDRSIFQEMNFFLKQFTTVTEQCDVKTLERLFMENFDGFVVDPVDPTLKWWTTLVLLNKFRAHEITYQIKKDEQNFYCVEIVGRRQQINEMDTKAEIRRVIRLPTEVDMERIRVLFTCEGFVIVKVPFKFTDEQRYNWMNRYMNLNSVNTFCQVCNDISLRKTSGVVLPEMDAQCTCLFNKSTQLLNGWGPVITEEMKAIQTEVYQLLPLLRPHRVIPYFLKENEGKEFKVILDLVMCDVIRPEEIQIQAKDQKITIDMKTERKYMNGQVESHCQTRKTFFVPRAAKLDKLEVRVMPNAHLRFVMPIDLKEKPLRFEGENISVKH